MSDVTCKPGRNKMHHKLHADVPVVSEIDKVLKRVKLDGYTKMGPRLRKGNKVIWLPSRSSRLVVPKETCKLMIEYPTVGMAAEAVERLRTLIVTASSESELWQKIDDFWSDETP